MSPAVVPGYRAAFIDRDGVLNALSPDPESRLPESPNLLGELELLPGVAAPLIALREAEFLLVCVTNQPAAAKQKSTVAELKAIENEVESRLASAGAYFDAVEMCLHHPEGTDPALTSTCACRKPAPGMLIHAAEALGVELERSWMIGDSDTDILAGKRAGCRSILIDYAPSAHRRSGDVHPDCTAHDLAEAVAYILGKGSG